ncbi:MAG: TolC family protein [Chitinophagaceae bacterium]|nr:TolC family protein [Chitinophagaceae bacterium]
MKPIINSLSLMGRSILLFFLLTGAIDSMSQPVLSMKEIREHIVQNHPAFKAVDASIQALDAEADGAFSWMAPEVGAGFFQAPYNVSKWSSSNGMTGMGMFMVSAEQMFPNKKAQQAEYDYLKSRGSVELEKKQRVLNDMMTRVRDAYYALMLSEKKLNLIEQNKKLLNFMIQSAEIRYKNDLGNINSYYKLSAALGRLSIDSQLIRVDEMKQKALIRSLMLGDESRDFSVDTSIHWFDFSSVMSDTSILLQNATYKGIQQQIQVNKLMIQSEQMALKPQFGIRFEHMAGFGRQPQMFSLMGMVKLPMAKWSSKMNEAKARSLELENESLLAEQRAFLADANTNIRTKWVEWKGVRQEMELYNEKIVPALEKNFRVNLLGFEQNKAEILELLDAWQELINAQNEQLNLLQSALQIQSELMNLFQITE